MKTKACGCRHDCDCSEQPPVAAPQSVVNPAGEHALSCRVGTHSTFFEELQRRLSSREYPELKKLHTRKLSDPSIALLDAWATVGDVLTFYNERFINEGYLRTATEHRSLTELSGLIGYRPGPGVASSVYLAFTLQKAPQQSTEETLISKGTAVKSIPGDKELPQTFETAEDLVGRPEWNMIRPRMEFPQNMKRENISQLDYLYISGLHPKLKPDDRILVFPRKRQAPEPLTITEVFLDQQRSRTRLSLNESPLSRASLYRDTKRATNIFLTSVPNPVPKSLQATFEAAKELLNGNSDDELQELSTTTALSEVNDRIDKLINTVLKPVPLDPLKTIEELCPVEPPSSSYISLASNVRKLVKKNASDWISKLNEAFDHLVTFSTIKDKLESIADDLGPTLPFSDAAIIAAKAACPPITSVPTPDYFSKHQEKLTDWITKLKALDPGDESTHTAYKNQSSESKRWWNGAINDVAQEKALQELTKSLQALVQTVQNAEMSGFPFTDLAESTETLSKTLGNALKQLGQPSSTVAKRITEVMTDFEGMIDLGSHASDLDTIKDNVDIPVTSATPLVGSFIIEFIQFKDPWDNADTELEKHNQAIKTAISVEKRMLDYVRVSQSIINYILSGQSNDSDSLADLIKRRNDAFLQVFDRVKTSVSDLSTSNSPNANSVIEILDNAHEILHGSPNNNLADKAKILLNKSAAMPTGTIIQLQEIVEPAESVLGKRIAALIEQLNSLWRVIREPVDITLIVSTDETFESAGILNALQSTEEQKKRRPTIIRSADDALSVSDKASADIIPQLISAMDIQGGKDLLAAWRNIQIPHEAPRISLVGETVSLFGYNAPRSIFDKNLKLIQAPTEDNKTEWKWAKSNVDFNGRVYLSQEQKYLPPWGSLYLHYGNDTEERFEYTEQKTVSRSDYGLTGKVTMLSLSKGGDWRKEKEDSIQELRTTVACLESEFFELSSIPITQSIGTKSQPEENVISDFDSEGDNEIELNTLYLGIKSGHKILITGELADASGIIRSELAHVIYVRHILRDIPGDTVHTRLFLERSLEHSYKRDTVTISANVVRATHGETVEEIIGSGDASQPFQSMPLNKGPLTHLPAPTVSGVASTLSVRVNKLLWHEKESLIDSTSCSRHYVVKSHEANPEMVQFGDGKTGALLPTGHQNVSAEYRVGLGVAGNVKAGKITQIARNGSLGLKDVNNPLPATGGADPETAEQIRLNAPLAVMAVDRLVSVRDYADFARNYAGIEKASAKRLTASGQSTVHITIAGTGDLPIATDSDLFVNLLKSFQQFGDPQLTVHVDVREMLLIFISARVRLLPDYAWEFVEPAIRERLYTSFSFSNRNLAQNLYLSEVLSTIQQVAGVSYVDIDVLNTLSQSAFENALQKNRTDQDEANSPTSDSDKPDNSLERVFKKLSDTTEMPKPVVPVYEARMETDQKGKHRILPAQIASLSREVPDSLFLSEIIK